MPRTDGGTSKLVWWMMGILATIVTGIAVILITGALTKLSTHADRLTKLEVEMKALESKVAEGKAGTAELKADVDRLRNPRPGGRRSR